ncbi:MAG: beta-lactamase family protein [Balneolales bacterium]|nr:beta-lactamase family protein [Balneolales bacterium]
MFVIKKIIPILCIQACAVFCYAQTNPTLDSKINELNSLINEEISGNRIPSIAVGIVKNGEVILAQGFGYADMENRVLASENTIYQLGSVTKVFTGHLLAGFIDQESLSLTDSLAKFFPSSVQVPKSSDGRPVTLKEIATHSSEFPRYPANLQRTDPDPIKGYSKAEMFEGIEMVSIGTAIGTRYNYSNFGYGVLGIAMENHFDKALPALMEEYIFAPYNMGNTSLTLNSTLEQNLAIPYLNNLPITRTEPWDMGALSAAGNLFSSISDLNTFMLKLLDSRTINKIQQTNYFSINDTWSYGLGCFIVDSEKNNTTVIYHGGDIDGYASSLSLYPEFDLGVVILTNLGEGQIVGNTISIINDYIAANFSDQN